MRYSIIDESNKVINITEIADDLLLEKLIRRGYNLKEITVPDLEIGDIYDFDKKEHIKKQPYPSWIFNSETKQWESPKKIDTSDKTKDYYWDEETKNYIIVLKNTRPLKTKIIPPIQK